MCNFWVSACVARLVASWNWMIIFWIFSSGMGYVIFGVCLVGLSTFRTSVSGPRSRLTG